MRAGPGGRIRSLLVVLQFAVSIGLITTTIVMVMQTRFARERQPRLRLQRTCSSCACPSAPIAPGTSRGRLARGPAPQSGRDRRGLIVGDPDRPVRRQYLDPARRVGEADPARLSTRSIPTSSTRSRWPRSRAGRRARWPKPPPSRPPLRTARRSHSGRRQPVGAGSARLSRSRPGDRAVAAHRRPAFEIVGVVPDIHFRSLHQPVRPEIYRLAEDAGGVISVRYRSAGLPGASDRVRRSLWRDLLPGRRDRARLSRRIGSRPCTTRKAGSPPCCPYSPRSHRSSPASGCSPWPPSPFSAGPGRSPSARCWARERRTFSGFCCGNSPGRSSSPTHRLADRLLCARETWLNQFAYRIDIPVSAFLLSQPRRADRRRRRRGPAHLQGRPVEPGRGAQI